MSDAILQENARYRRLLQETLSMLESFGVRPGVGIDGQLMQKIQAEVSGQAIIFNPNAKMGCPLCKAPDFNECGCPVDEQLAAMGG